MGDNNNSENRVLLTDAARALSVLLPEKKFVLIVLDQVGVKEEVPDGKPKYETKVMQISNMPHPVLEEVLTVGVDSLLKQLRDGKAEQA